MLYNPSRWYLTASPSCAGLRRARKGKPEPASTSPAQRKAYSNKGSEVIGSLLGPPLVGHGEPAATRKGKRVKPEEPEEPVTVKKPRFDIPARPKSTRNSSRAPVPNPDVNEFDAVNEFVAVAKELHKVLGSFLQAASHFPQ